MFAVDPNDPNAKEYIGYIRPEFVTIGGMNSQPRCMLDNLEYHLMQRDNEYINTSCAGGASSSSTSTSTVPSAGMMSTTSNPQTHINVQQPFNPPVHMNGHGSRKKSSTDEEDDHEYYNEYSTDSRLKRELQPLNQHRRNETTV